MNIEVTIDNVYDDETITNEYMRNVEVPQDDEDLDDWAYDELFPLTGTGREDGEAGYFLKITACSERPDLVGREFEWGT